MSTLLAAQNLNLSRSGKQICTNLNLTIKPHEVWGILGINGIGKTTLLHTLAGLMQPQNGEINLSNASLSKLSKKAIAKQMAVLLQDHHYPFPDSVFNLALAGRHPHLKAWCWESNADQKIVAQALDVMGLAHMQRRFVHTLSGGERQRLAIATVLAQTPKVFLLDEPTNHLDVHYQMRVLSHFKHLARNQACTVIMALHDVNHALRFCDHLILLFGNGLVRSGICKELATQENIEALYQHPFQQGQVAGQTFWAAKNVHQFGS